MKTTVRGSAGRERRSSGPFKAIATLLASLAALACLPLETARGTTIYQTSFDNLALGQTQPFPGAPGQDGWYRVLAAGAAIGEIEPAIAHPGRALHELAPSTNQAALQTIDRRDISPVNIAADSMITLASDFFSHSSDLSRVNNYLADQLIEGGSPQDGFVNGSEVIGFHLRAGNGTAKSVTGLNVSLDTFNGSNNNEPISTLTVGQHLSWDTWHTLSLLINPVADRYVSLTVDGQTQNLSAFPLPRVLLANAQWVREPLIEDVFTQIVPDNVGGTTTSDDVYWDNISLTAVPEPSAVATAAIALLACGVWALRPQWSLA